MACGQSCRRLSAGKGIKIEPDCCSGCEVSINPDDLPPQLNTSPAGAAMRHNNGPPLPITHYTATVQTRAVFPYPLDLIRIAKSPADLGLQVMEAGLYHVDIAVEVSTDGEGNLPLNLAMDLLVNDTGNDQDGSVRPYDRASHAVTLRGTNLQFTITGQYGFVPGDRIGLRMVHYGQLNQVVRYREARIYMHRTSGAPAGWVPVPPYPPPTTP